MRLRVVCGFDVTMAIFCPTRRLRSVDFPAFGRPRMATNPERKALFFPTLSFSAIAWLMSWLEREVSCRLSCCSNRAFPSSRLYDRQLHGAGMLRIMHDGDMRGLRIFSGFRRDDSAAIVVFRRTRRIDAVHNQPQPAPLCNAPREKREIVKDKFFRGSGRHGLCFAKCLAIARPHRCV